jgi:hypothetical protein
MTFCPQITNDRCVESGASKVFSRMRKLLFRTILATLGVGGLVTGLPSAVLSANPTVLSQPESNFSTLSGESLRGIENRNNSKDYLTSETKPRTERKPILLSRNTKAPAVQIPPLILDVIKRVEVNTGGSSLDSDQVVKVRYRMDSR